VIALWLSADGTSSKVVVHPPASDYRPQPDRTFFWGTNLIDTFTSAQRAELVSSRHVVVISPSLDGYNLHQQEVQAKKLNAVDPQVQAIFYFNTKHYLNEASHPRYMHGFDPATMALHDASGQPVLFHVTRLAPQGIGYYVDESSPAWHAFYLRTAARVLAAGHFDGIAMDSLRPLTSVTDRAAAPRLTSAQIAAWNHGQQRLLKQVRARFPGKTVLYNGISQTVPGQIDRDLGPLDVADGTLNEEFCLERGEPNAAHIRTDLTLMATAAGRHKVVLEKVNYDLAHALTLPQLAGVRDRWGDFCLGAFLLGWDPGSTYFDFSDGYGIDQLGTEPAELDLDLGAPTAAASFTGDVGSRTFQRGQVYVNLGDGVARVTVASDVTRVDNGVVVGQYRSGDTISVGPEQAAFLVPRP
jgi:hypothetical protein